MGMLHLHNQSGDKFPQPTDLGNGFWETGAWYVSEARAETMKGADIHIHRKKSEPSFRAGIIINSESRDYLDPRDGQTKRRTHFRFRNVPGMEGATTGPDGWLQNGTKWIP